MTPVEPCQVGTVMGFQHLRKNKKITQIGISASLRVENKNNHASWSSGLFVI